jgi:predicted amidohydrolase
MRRSALGLRFRFCTTCLVLVLIYCAGHESVAIYGSFQPAPVKTVASKVALIHSNPKLGDLNANVRSLTSSVGEAFRNGANIVVTPELATTGYCVTTDQVINAIGMESPFPQLNEVRDLAIQYHGYVFLALAEKSGVGKAYNSVVVFGPKGLITTQRKRGIATWNTRGDVPFEIIATPFGDLGAVICSDSYLPDWVRVLTLKGADIVVSPANWWGDYGQEEIWQTRARENGIWFLVANRWGTEVDGRYGTPYTYEMNDAPSDVISPDGAIVLSYRAKESASPADKILYYTIQVPVDRIGNTANTSYTVFKRRPEAYEGIANEYYRPDLGNQPPPAIPQAGLTRVGAITYLPSGDGTANLSKIEQLWGKEHADVVVLPGLGITPEPIESSRPRWYTASPWAELQEFVNQHGILLLATTVREKLAKGGPSRIAVLVIQRERPPNLFGQIHDYRGIRGTGLSPSTVDLPHARVAILTGPDSLFPELSTSLVKRGADLVLVSSELGGKARGSVERPVTGTWDTNALLQAWKTCTDHGFHLAVSDNAGFGLMIQDGGGFPVRKELLNSSRPVQVFDLDTGPIRSKHLNAYYSFDLRALLSAAKRAIAKGAVVK